MPQADGPRLDSRDRKIWNEYLCGTSQADIARKYKLSHQRVSQVLTEIRAALPTADLGGAALTDLARLELLLSGVMPAAAKGDTKAGGMALRLLERRAKLLGLDAPEHIGVVLERRTEDMSALVADALSEAMSGLLDALDFAAHERLWAVEVGQYGRDLAVWVLAGRDGPRPAAPPPRPAAAVERAVLGELMPGPGWAGTEDERAVQRVLAEILDADVVDDDDDLEAAG